MKKSVLVPTDLSEVASNAIRQAEVIAKKAGTGVSLLHVLNDKSPSLEKVRSNLEKEAARAAGVTGIEGEILIKEGSIFEVIPQVSCDNCYDILVIGTHGIHGIRQAFFGADIFKLLNKLNTPALVVQPESKVNRDFRSMVLPVCSHPDFRKAIDAVIFFSGLFGTEIHLYSIYKPGFEWPEQLLKNIEDTKNTLEEHGVRLKRIKEEQTVYSQGYSRQTLLYAGTAGADLITIMSAPSEDYYYFAQSDKESLLLNDLHLPVLCVG